MDKYEAVVRSLQERSQQLLPLRYRREMPLQPIPVEALCEYEGEQVTPPSSHQQHGGAAGSVSLVGCARAGRAPGKRTDFASDQEATSPAAGMRRRLCSAPWGSRFCSSGRAVQEGSGGKHSGEQCASHTPFRRGQPGSVTFPCSLQCDGEDVQVCFQSKKLTPPHQHQHIHIPDLSVSLSGAKLG